MLASVKAKTCSDDVEIPIQPSDTDLYHHYLQHSSRTLTYCQRDQCALQIGIPTLALQSKTVFHSLLAVSAVCICCDMISRESPPDIRAVKQVLVIGYRHYNLASERMRGMISDVNILQPEPFLTSSLLLVPFATASQQINHWISSRSDTEDSPRFLAITPRDVLVLLRGVKTTLQALAGSESDLDLNVREQMELAADNASSLLEPDVPPKIPPPSRTHLMFPIIAATSEVAFLKLQQRLDSICPRLNDEERKHSNAALSACAAAFELISNVRTSTFSPSECSPPKWLNETVGKPSKPEEVSLPQLSPWLRAWATTPSIALPTDPLTRPFLTFYVQTPQEYFDLVLPLLDQRLESPIQSKYEEVSAALTREQALALDIYAHWSVLMFLVEEESWWIGQLPLLTLTGMVNTYGDDFVHHLWPAHGPDQEQWWPGSMLRILREIKQYR